MPQLDGALKQLMSLLHFQQLASCIGAVTLSSSPLFQMRKQTLLSWLPADDPHRMHVLVKCVLPHCRAC